ncbi:MAG: PilZ domain-containing protein [Rhodoferax sp.]|uniref:PilZ domain-containing protein n=1 Tax=Rhodoferax sp. TaxID=50421 RepID=UPI00262F1EF5|nr:PilZ domain-containing protein [Rhodoferax sp.]MDD2881799.1 PilZ domain-containing protein [Rhodoferax sp.]
MSTPAAEGHRLFSRVPFSAQVSLQLADQTLKVDLLDIALKGALVRTPTPMAVALGAPCHLVLPLTDGGESIEMNGKVAHLENRNIGVACDEIDLQSLTRLRRLLELNTGDADLMDRELSHLFTKRTE